MLIDFAVSSEAYEKCLNLSGIPQIRFHITSVHKEGEEVR